MREPYPRSFSRGNQTAEVFLIGWAFAYLIEGCSGFGTPTALAAPLLVEIGYPKEATVIACLIFNTLATPFGAAGTPIWFGLDNLADDDKLITVGFWAQCVCFTAAHVIPVWAATNLVPLRNQLKNLTTLLVCIYSCAGLSLAVSYFSYELPTLLGGGIGLVVSALFVKATNNPHVQRVLDSMRRSHSSREEVRDVEMSREGDLVKTPRDKEFAEPTWKYVFPLGAVVFYLTLTRFPIIDIKDELKSERPRAEVRLGSLGEGWVSSAVVIGLSDIFREPVTTTFELLYVPAFLPFFAVSMITMVLFGKQREIPAVLGASWNRTRGVLLPIASALVLAAIMRAGVASRLSRPIISTFGKRGWIIVTPLLGVLGSFFSGSTTVSNLTFASIHSFAAQRLGLNKIHLLGLQTVGATIGNCICLQNIIQAKAVVGLDTPEALFIKKTFKPAALFVAIAWAWGFVLLAT